MKKYSAYKESGIEWIGEIPEGWNIVPLKHIVTCNDDSLPENTEKDLTIQYIEIGDVSSVDGVQQSTEYFFGKAPSRARRIVKSGDVIISTVRTYLKAITSISPSYEGSIVSTGFAVLRPNSVDSGYLGYLALVEGVIGEIISLSKGVSYPSITASDLLSIGVVVPDSEFEQTTIANYLDRKTTEIDTLIEKKKQLIALYKEERTATINAAVTGKLDVSKMSELGCSGLNDGQDLNNLINQVNPKNPNADKRKMKDSGIEWIGEIPEHWEVKKIKHITSKIGSGVTPKGGAEIYLARGIPLLRSQNVCNDGFRLSDVAFISNEIHKRMSGSKVFQGDVLLNITGGSIGRSFFVSNEFQEANVNQHVCILRPNEDMLPEFLHAFITSQVGQLQIQFCQLGGNREAVNFEQLKNFLIPWVSVDDQVKIMSSLSQRTKEINRQISKTQKEITLLQEYKTALISEVVLGKVDVREETV